MTSNMTNIVVIYSTTDGQTKKICDRLVRQLRSQSNVDLFSINENIKIDLESYEKIIIGASIRYGKHSPLVYDFVEENKQVLLGKFTAFFTVNVVARKPKKNTPETNPYMKKFLKFSKWQPTLLGVFAGRIDYPKYKFIDRLMIRLIMFITSGPTDISGTFEFTDWDEVDNFGHTILSAR